MPKSKAPRRASRGNVYTLTSREFKVLNERLNDVLGQLRQTQRVIGLMLTDLTKAEAASEEPIPVVPLSVPSEVVREVNV